MPETDETIKPDRFANIHRIDSKLVLPWTEILATSFNLEELKTVCQSTGYDWEVVFMTDSKRGKCSDLITYADRRGQIHELLAAIISVGREDVVTQLLGAFQSHQTTTPREIGQQLPTFLQLITEFRNRMRQPKNQFEKSLQKNLDGYANDLRYYYPEFQDYDRRLLGMLLHYYLPYTNLIQIAQVYQIPVPAYEDPFLLSHQISVETSDTDAAYILNWFKTTILPDLERGGSF